MEYKRKNDLIFFRLDRGEEIISSLLKIAEKEDIVLASINGIGACDELTIGVYNVREKKYYQKIFKGEFEITSLNGNISRKDDEIYLHLHINYSDANFLTFGGHLNHCRISATLEGIINIIDIENNRIKDETTGLNLLRFKN